MTRQFALLALLAIAVTAGKVGGYAVAEAQNGTKPNSEAGVSPVRVLTRSELLARLRELKRLMAGPGKQMQTLLDEVLQLQKTNPNAPEVTTKREQLARLASEFAGLLSEFGKLVNSNL